MPEVSRFLGIVIGMFYREHGVVDWQLAQQGQPLKPIPPLE